eukprot:7272858-Pyramimonas_sp.AAC.1
MDIPPFHAQRLQDALSDYFAGRCETEKSQKRCDLRVNIEETGFLKLVIGTSRLTPNLGASTLPDLLRPPENKRVDIQGKHVRIIGLASTFPDLLLARLTARANGLS